MKRYKTAKLLFSFEENRFFIMPSADIVAYSLWEAVQYCKEYHPELVVCGERQVFAEDLQIGKHVFKFNYN